jgi:predicted dehydrogenase
VSEGPVVTAVVGAGGWGRNHVRNFAALPGAELRYVCDRDEAVLARTQADYPGVRVDGDLARVLRDEELEAVVVATDAPNHFAVARAALEAGKHVLVEKPVAARLDEAEALATAADAAPQVVAVVSQFRFDRDLRRMKLDLDAGAVGTPTDVHLRMTWSRDAAYFAAGDGWRGRYGGVLLNQAIHWLDVLLWMLGPGASPVEARLWKARAEPGACDSAQLLLRWESGLVAQVDATTAASANEPLELRVRGTRGELRLPARGGGSDAALECQLREFVGAVCGSAVPSVGPREGLAALRLVKACEAAAGLPDRTGP